MLLKLLTFSALTPEQMMARSEYEGDERVRLAYAKGKGILFFTGHFGFWELQALAHAREAAADWRAGARARQPAVQPTCSRTSAPAPATGDLPAGRRSPRDEDAGRRRRRGHADRSAHAQPRRDLGELLPAARRHHVDAGGARAQRPARP